MDPRVEEVPDNVATEAAEKPAEVKPPTEYECISDITTAVFDHYAASDMPIKSCRFRGPMQLTDGCVCDILAPNGSTVATCRMRFRNRAAVVSERGDLRLELYLTDLAFPGGNAGVEVRMK